MYRTRKKTSKLIPVLLAGLAAALVWGGYSYRSQQELADKVVRLHVLANSDSQEDQALKLQVRDAVLQRAEELLDPADSRREAQAVLETHLTELAETARQAVTAAGYSYSVTAELADTVFPTREYDDFRLPAGEYLALRVVIGEGGGQNWWCVVFPPLCTASSADFAQTAMAAGMRREDVALITEEDGYVLKFKSVEAWEWLRRQLA